MLRYTDNISLYITTEDPDYTDALIRTLPSVYPGCRYTVGSGDLSASDSYDVILADYNAVYNVPAELRDKVVALYDAEEVSAPMNITSIDKFSTIDDIAYTVALKFADSTGRPTPLPVGHSSTYESFSFFSVEGGAGTTSIAYASAMEMSRYRGRKVLFLSREPYETNILIDESSSNTDNPDSVHGSEKYIYHYLRGDNDKLSRLLRALIVIDSHGVMRFRPGALRNRMSELSESAFTVMRRGLAASLDADTIVTDCGVRLPEADANDRNILIRREDSVKAFALNFDRNILEVVNMTKGRSSFFDKPLHLPWDDVDESDNPKVDSDNTLNDKAVQGSKIFVPYDRSDFRKKNGGIAIGLSNVFGRSVKELVDTLLNPEISEVM